MSLDIRIRSILVPLDFSAHADAVLAWAGHLAQEHGSQVVLLHAYHLPVEFQQLEATTLPPEFWTSVKEEAVSFLERKAETLRAEGLQVETVVKEGYAATVIEAEARQRGVDLVVIGTRGLSGLKHLLLGSVAERVVQHAPCPVLTVKAPA
jgi:nucleotide-binding universal stress UspA family protein